MAQLADLFTKEQKINFLTKRGYEVKEVKHNEECVQPFLAVPFKNGKLFNKNGKEINPIESEYDFIQVYNLLDLYFNREMEEKLLNE